MSALWMIPLGALGLGLALTLLSWRWLKRAEALEAEAMLARAGHAAALDRADRLEQRVRVLEQLAGDAAQDRQGTREQGQ